MAVKTRIPQIARSIRVAIDKTLSPPAMSRQLAKVARGELSKATAQNTRVLGYPPEHVTYVDGRKGASEDTVRPNGVIVYEFSDAVRADVLRFIHDQLVKAAPKGRTQRYSRSFRIYADNIEVSDFRVAANASLVLFSSTVPYARKIEGNKLPGYKSAPQSSQAPDGVFHATAALAKARYGNQAAVKFTMTDVFAPGSELEQWASKTTLTRTRWSRGTSRHMKARSQWLRRQPAVSVSFR